MNLREIDALVAEKVMGETFPKTINRTYRASNGMPTYSTLTQELPFYTRDISAAWEVINKVNQVRGLENFILSFHHADWWCEFSDESQSGGSSAAEAICRSALKYVGVEV